MSVLFSPLTLRGTTFANRLWVAPMCQYSAHDGVVGEWHRVHLGSFATGGFGLVMSEATAVSPEGRISVACPGLYRDDQEDAWRIVVDFLHSQGVLAGVQLAHAALPPLETSTRSTPVSRSCSATQVISSRLSPPSTQSVAEILTKRG